MAKKAPVKKSRRRLKRSVRRSLSAVLMITAIGVAAIPVPENRASAPGEIMTIAEPIPSYSEAQEQIKDYDDSHRPEGHAEYDTKTSAGEWNYESVSSSEGNKTLYSLDIYNGGLYWQYKIDQKARKVLRYNNSYPSATLTLSQKVPTSYEYVLKKDFDDFVNTTTYKLEKNNYSSSSDIRLAKQFFEKYFANDTEYQNFMRQITDPGAEDLPQPEITEIERKVSELSDPEKRAWYCVAKNIGEDYVLESVSVEVGTSGDDSAALSQLGQDGGVNKVKPNDIIYIPKYVGTPENAPESTLDEEGYKLGSDQSEVGLTQQISAVGNYAFAGNGILSKIELPDWLDSIGVGSFMDCVYLESVSIPFLREIPAGAFKNCASLRTVDWWSYGDGEASPSGNLTKIDLEAFYGTGVVESSSGSGTLRLPISVTEIGDAAFCNCSSLTSLEFHAPSVGSNTTLGNYAFYDNTALTSVVFDNKKITKLGDYCFAVGVYSNAMTSFTFPNSAVLLEHDGKSARVLAGRSALTQITVPENVTKIPAGTLDGCTGLQSATFVGAGTSYDKTLFNDVTQEDFYVTGPARMTMGATTDDVKDASQPRRSTWDADQTAAGQNIPYLYSIGGKEYYEVCSGEGYLESIDKATGTLTSCDLKEGATITNGELIIPDKVGSTIVTGIAKDCFKGKTGISDSVQRLVIGNNLRNIDDEVFKSWKKLREVEIGKSIQSIGGNAFADCQNLEDVTFATPDSYTALASIGTDAFATRSGKLTFHGDIVEGYAPFEYAMNPDQYVENFVQAGSAEKYRILYQSRWDSPSSKHMSVIYGEFDDGEGHVTLVDYPIYKDFFDKENGINETLQQHNRDMERQFYNAYGNYAYPSEEDAYLEEKVRFAHAYAEASSKGDVESSDVYKTTDGKDGTYYGPWINPSFCANWEKWNDKKWLLKFNLSASADSDILDWLFKPLVVEASDGPKAYFEKNPYDFLANYTAVDGVKTSVVDYVDYKNGWSVDEEAMIKAVERIVIPAGVDSIDLKGYYEAEEPDTQNVASNMENYVKYFGQNSGNNREKIFIYGVDGDSVGLFRGPIDDLYEGDGHENDRTNVDDEDIDKQDQGHQIGNDRIKSVDMSQSSVTSIPEYAFEDCELLETVLLPASCVETGALPFKDCERLAALESASENLPAQNGILYQKKDDGSYELVECIQGKGLNGDGTIVSGANDDPYLSQVSSIGESAFENCKGIAQVDLSCIDNGPCENKLKTIPNSCFKNCDNLQKVYLPQATKDIGQEAFANIREEYYYAEHNPTDQPRLEITIRGSEFNISETAFDPKSVDNEAGDLSTIDMVTIWTYEDTAVERYVLEQQKKGYDVRLGGEGKDHKDHEYLGRMKRVNFWDWNADVLCNTVYLPEGRDYIKEDEVPLEAQAIVNEANHRPGYTFAGWLGVGGQKIGDTITGDEITYVAQYESDGTMVNGKYVVEFLDGIDGHQLKSLGANIEDGKYYVDAGTSFTENKFSIPTPEQHDGYQFKEWSGGFTENTVINGNMTIISLYSALPTSGGSTTNPSSGSTTNPGGNSGNTTSNRSSSSSNTSSSTSSSSTSTSSTTSGSNSTVGKYTVTVENGSGSGSYDVGSTVVISAADPAAGMKFQKWTTESNGVALASVSLPATTFTMPANNVTVTANYVEDTGTTAAPVSNTGGTTNIGTTTTGDGTDRVDITKPGISNKDLATADVNGSTDNFIVKITETDEATRAVADALTNKYGSLDNILYYAMDISLYDSTGTTKISDTTGLTVDITIPIPDALVAYGGNNMAGAVVNGNQLESLNENFTSINGVPCIRFTATHFSPYTIYVDTGNLTEGMIDTTPKTGDPIHPKWFLSIGLACLSVILFMKKDKGVKAKTA